MPYHMVRPNGLTFKQIQQDSRTYIVVLLCAQEPVFEVTSKCDL